MVVQAAGHAVIGLGLAAPLVAGLVGSVLLGLGTAMVYPAMLAASAMWLTPVAGHVARRLPILARSRVRGGRAYGWRPRGNVRLRRRRFPSAGILTLLSGLMAWALMSETLARGASGHCGCSTQIQPLTRRFRETAVTARAFR